MRCRIGCLSAAIVVLTGLYAVCCADAAVAAPKRKPMPPLPEVEGVVIRYFQAMPEHHPGKIIARSEVEPLFGMLQQMGWTVRDRLNILNRVPADSSFLNRSLRTPAGYEFMRRLGNYPTTYDQLDRLSQMPRGRNTVKVLINSVPGKENITQWSVTTEKGRKFSRLLSKSRMSGKHFNQPTGKIYTAESLLAELRKSYAAEKAAAEAKKPR